MDWTPDRLTSLATAYWQSATLMAAVELGLFDAFEHGPVGIDEAARMIAAPVATTAALAEALVALEMLVREGDASNGSRFSLAPSLRPLVARSSPTSMRDALRYNADLYRQWAQLAGVVQTGEPVLRHEPHLGGDLERTRRFVLGMESKARAFAPLIAPLIDLGDAKNLLDVGAGPGTLTRLLLAAYPCLRATLFDLPDVLEVAREVVAQDANDVDENGMDVNTARRVAERVAFHPGDYRVDALPTGFDAVLYAGALHQENADDARRLIGKLFAAVRPGGRVFVVDLMLDAGRAGPAFSALFQLSMLLSKPDARVYAEDEVGALLHAAGFTAAAVRVADGTPYRVVTATRPG